MENLPPIIPISGEGGVGRIKNFQGLPAEPSGPYILKALIHILSEV